MAITPLPTPVPNRGMSEEDFANAGDEFLGSLPNFVTEANALQVDVNNKQVTASNAATTATTQATNAATSATNASTSATTASNWAIKVGSVVSGSDWSAKEHAVGTAVTTGSAKDWATKTSGTVAGTDYSAKYYSQVAQTAAAAAQSAAGLPSLTGNAGKVLTVNSTSNGVTWATAGAGSAIGDTLTTAVTMSTPTWLPCDGAVYLKSSYSALSTLLGTLYSATPWTAVAGGNWGIGVVGNMVVTADGSLIANDANDTTPIRSTNGGVSWNTVTATQNATHFAANASGVVVGIPVPVGAVQTNTITRSTNNGTSWANASIPPMAPLSIAASTSGSVFVIVGGDKSSGTLVATEFGRYSNDGGATWNTTGSLGVGIYYAVTYSQTDNLFYAFRNGACVRGLSNGSTWNTAGNPGIGLAGKAAASCGGTTIVVVNDGDISTVNNVSYSTDTGNTWTSGKLPGTLTNPNIIFVTGIGFIVGGTGGKIHVSADGKGNWKTYTGDSTAKTYGALAFLNNKLIAQPASGGTYTSSIFNPYGYDTTTSFATPIINPSTNGGAKTYMRANA